MTNADLINLPPSLEELTAAIRGLTVDGLLSLPRNIRKFQSISLTPINLGLMKMRGWPFLVASLKPFRRIFSLPREDIDFMLEYGC